MRHRGQDVPAGRLFCNTLYPDHRPVLINLRHSSLPLCPQSGQAVGEGWHGASKPTPHHPPTVLPIPAGFALSSPLGRRGWPHSMHCRRRGAQGQADCCTIQLTEAVVHESKVSFQPHSKVIQEHVRWIQRSWF